MMGKKDGRVIAAENDIRVLRALHRFGWLRTRDIASLSWQRWAAKPVMAPTLAPARFSAAGLRMAQRTLKRLREQRAVISAQAPDGSLIYALAEAGVRRLKEAGVDAVGGKDLVRSFSSAFFRHRCISNEVAIGAMVEGYRVSTEREIAQGAWLGGEAGIAGKRPDVVIRHDGHFWFIEVERSRKSAKDYAALLSWLAKVLRDKLRPQGAQLLGPTATWERVVFICTTAFEVKLRHDLQAAGWSAQQINVLLWFETELYRFKDILF